MTERSESERAELVALNEWMREPDYADNFSLCDITDWINRRPIATAARLAAQDQKPVAGPTCRCHDDVSREYWQMMYTDLLKRVDAGEFRPVPVAAIDPRWRTELDEIIGHLGAAVIQSIASDDQIIMDHVKSAHEIAKVIRRQA